MKHLLNNMSEEEKNSIREQHTGGINLMIENFNKLINSKSGNVKPLVNEGYDIGSTFKVGAVTYTIKEIGTMDCKFSITVTDMTSKKDMTYTDANINTIPDVNLKNTMSMIRRDKMRQSGC